MPTAAIISKPQKPEMESILTELTRWLSGHGYEFIVDPESAAYLGAGTASVERTEMQAYKPQLVISLGGDGTLLSAARAFAQAETPILGVNLGSLGFLTEVPLSELYTALEAWIAGTAIIDTRSLLHAELRREGKLVNEWDALNDVVLSKGAIARMGEFAVELDGQFVARFRADGVIVSTPTGVHGVYARGRRPDPDAQRGRDGADGDLSAPADDPADCFSGWLGDLRDGGRGAA
jgi:NAD+ kinase